MAEQGTGPRTALVLGGGGTRGAASLFRNDSLRSLLETHLPVRSFGELPIPLTIVATDLESGETVVLKDGKLIQAILASTALPGLLPPISWQGCRLVDGGLSNNVPIDVAVELGAERVFTMLCGCSKALPRRANLVTVLGQSFSLALNARVRCDVCLYEPRAELHILEPCLAPSLELLDFDRAWTLIEPAYRHALRELQRKLAPA